MPISDWPISCTFGKVYPTQPEMRQGLFLEVAHPVFVDIPISSIGSSIVLLPIAGRMNIWGTNDTQTGVIGSGEVGETLCPEPIQFCGMNPIVWNESNCVEPMVIV